MKNNPKFDDIRPYYESEIPAAMLRIAQNEVFPVLASFIYPDEDLEAVKERISSFKTVREFQHDTMFKVNEQIIKRSISDFSCSGIENLDKNTNYLFVSNHRDIMLDSSLFQYYLVKQGFETTEITFGSNLMMTSFITDIGKSNKMFEVKRPSGNIKDFYTFSQHLSEYIRYAITEKKQSVWIAQRNGRTKNGFDATDQGIIKMFCMSADGNRAKALSDLHIVPLSVSYEWEPCDFLKSVELYHSQKERYVKKPGEDLESILTGITQFKGRVHFEICKPISDDELSLYNSLTNNEFHKQVARLIDHRINAAYRLFPNSYIAHDMLSGNNAYSDYYSETDKNEFLLHLKMLEKYNTCNLDTLREIMLKIYSNPIENKLLYL